MTKNPTPEETKVNAVKYPAVFLCVDKATSIIYEAQTVNDFVLVRPATPSLYGNLTRLSLSEFSDKFSEYEGDSSTAHTNPGEMFISFDKRPRPQPEKKSK